MLIVLLSILIGFTIWADTAQSAWPKFSGPASVFGNDPIQGFYDGGDNCVTALGTSCTAGGIAVNNPKIGWQRSRDRYLGGWWWVCPPKWMRKACKLLRQTDAGPSAKSVFGAQRVLDLTSVAARRAWRISVYAFPTDRGRWTLSYRGRKRPGTHHRHRSTRHHVRTHSRR